MNNIIDWNSEGVRNNPFPSHSDDVRGYIRKDQRGLVEFLLYYPVECGFEESLVHIMWMIIHLD